MTTEPTTNSEANADDIDVETTMKEAMALEAAQRAVASPSAVALAAAESSPVFKPPAADGLGGAQRNDIDMILDIPVQLTVELGRVKVPTKNLFQLVQGSAVGSDALAGEPMNVLIDDYLIVQGEVVVVNEKLGIRLTDITTLSECIRKLNR